MARLTFPRALLLGIAVGASALAACSNSSSTPTPTPTVKPTTSPSAGPTSTPAASVQGVVYLPDAGNGAPPGLTIARFLASNGGYYHYYLENVNFGASVKSFSIASDSSVALAVTKSPTTGVYSYLQGVLGMAQANPIPGGPIYDTSILPTAAPSASPPPNNAVIPYDTSTTILQTSGNAVGLSMGPDGQGILGVNQLNQQALHFNGFIGYSCNGNNFTPVTGRNNILVSAGANGSGNYSVLVRGPNDLVTFAVTPNFNVSPPIYVFCVAKQDTTLGTYGGIEGRGAMTLSPADSTRAILAQTNTSGNTITLVTGLPGNITKAAPITLSGASRANSVSIQSAGNYAVVGADSGLYVVSGIRTGKLAPVPQGSPAIESAYAPYYKGGDGANHRLQNVTSVGFTSDGGYIAALASTTPKSPGGGTTASIILLPFDATNGVISAPVLVDNNVVTPAYTQDYMVVK